MNRRGTSTSSRGDRIALIHSSGGMPMKRLKWWHWALIAVVVFTAVDWIWSGENPITSFVKGFAAGSSGG
jgi:hypothetical protein